MYFIAFYGRRRCALSSPAIHRPECRELGCRAGCSGIQGALKAAGAVDERRGGDNNARLWLIVSMCGLGLARM